MLISFLLIGGFVGFVNFESENAQGTPVSGLIIIDTTWDLGGSPYIVVGDITVVSGVTLTIDPGVEVKFDGYYSIYIDGTLIAIGTETDRINITSNMATPEFGDWQNIQINSDGHAEIEYCNISYGNYCIYLYSSYNNITNNNISYNWEGIHLSSSSYNNITDNDISNNWDGIYLETSSNNNITNNNVSWNVFYGIEFMSSSNNNITTNNISWNDQDGIYLSSSSANTIANNDLSNNRDGIALENSSSNTVADNDAFSNSNGISLAADSNYNTIANNTATNSYTGLQISNSNNNTIINNIVSHNDCGIHLVWSISNTLTDNQMIGDGIDISGEGVDVWNTHYIDTSNTVNGKPVHYWKNQNGGTVPPGAGEVILANCTNVRIENQNVGNGSIGILLGFSNNNYVANNTASSNTRYTIQLRFSEYNTLTNNIVSQGSGFYFYYSSNNSLTGNKMSYLSAGIVFSPTGILFTQSSNYNNVTDNVVSPNFYKGISITSSIGNTVKDNILSNNGYGICIQSSSGNNIVNNYILNNWYGLDIHSSSDNNISNNIILNNLFGGMYLRSSSDENDIIDNIFLNNSEYGLRLSSSNENEIVDNSFLRTNGYGLHLSDSSRNRIYHNNLIDNTDQAYDDMNDNFWNESYPAGGNYWSDFDEPVEGAYDDYKGINQNVLGSDYIVDNGTIGGGGKNPYKIDADSQDNYPLINLTRGLILYEGWNLISIPSIQIETDPGTVLSSISGAYSAIQWFNSTDPDDPWKHNCTTKPQYLNDFDSIDHMIGFWIYISEPGAVILEYYGPPPGAPQNIPLHMGWNMVGFPSLSNKNRTVGLNNLDFGVEVDAIWAFDAATKTWESAGPGDDFQLGRGYWVHAIQECMWEVPL